MIYLIHLLRPYKHAQHYVGYSENVLERYQRHKSGNGNPLLNAANLAHIPYWVVRTWPGDRTLERRIKNQNSTWKLCPICNGHAHKRMVQHPINPA